MSEHKLARQPVPVTVADDEVTFKSCATEVFRWARKVGELIEETPAYLQELGEDLAQAWEDSSKK
jgi:hypothetical protein